MSTHSMTISDTSSNATCDYCGLTLRLATYDEAVFIYATNGYEPNGPILGQNNMTMVPLDFSLFQEA